MIHTCSSAIIYDFDASDTNNFTFAGTEESRYPDEWKSSAGNLNFMYDADSSSITPTLTKDYFGGNYAVVLGSSGGYTCLELSEANNSPKSLFMVLHEIERNAYAGVWGEGNNYTYGIGRRNGKDFNYYTKRQGSLNGDQWGFYRNGVATEYMETGSDIVRSVIGAEGCVRSGKKQVLGVSAQNGVNHGKEASYSFYGAYGEVVGMSKYVNHAERKAIEAYLMSKWNIGNATYNVIPATADVTMNAGATLDMGGLTQTVKSFTGAGTVANGYLKTTGDLTVDGGTLTIQATAGQTYVLSDVETERLVLTGDAKDYTVKVPDNGRIVGRFVVPEGISVGFEGEGADVTVVNAPKGWSITGKPVAGGILYRVGSFPFVLKLR